MSTSTFCIATIVVVAVIVVGVVVADEMVDAIHERRRQAEWKRKLGKIDENNLN